MLPASECASVHRCLRFAHVQALLVSPIINLHEGLISLISCQTAVTRAESAHIQQKPRSGTASPPQKPFVSEKAAHFALAQQPPFPIFERYFNGVHYVINNDEWAQHETENDAEWSTHTNGHTQAKFLAEQSSWAVFGSGPRQCPGRQVALAVLSAAGSALLAGKRVIDPADGHNCSGRMNDGTQRTPAPPAPQPAPPAPPPTAKCKERKNFSPSFCSTPPCSLLDRDALSFCRQEFRISRPSRGHRAAAVTGELRGVGCHVLPGRRSL